MNDIIDSIGLPAMLEQLAEECSELAQASLKYARFLRGENPTPKTEQECLAALTEEIADVELCINILMLGGIVDEDWVLNIMQNKEIRWNERLIRQNKKNEE